MKNINYHFNLRFPSDFYDQEVKSEIIGFIRGFYYGRSSCGKDACSEEESISYLNEIVLFEVYDIQFVKFNQERKEGEKEIELTVNIDIDVTDKSPYLPM